MKRISTSQLNSQIRRVQSQIRHNINSYNRAINDYNRKVNEYNREVKKAVNNYNSAVRQHNSQVLRNRNKINQELKRLSSSTNSSTYRVSVSVLQKSYVSVSQIYDSIESMNSTQEQIYSGVEQENANNLQVANVILNKTEPNNEEISLQDTIIMDKLSKISVDLDKRWQGALFSLNPNNPDATRHFCTSSREIFTEIFEKKATDNEVFSVFPNCEKTERGNATRRAKIKYFLYLKGMLSDEVADFVENDIENILELYHILSNGTHGQAGTYTINQLKSIKKRIEDGLNFLCDIVA